MRGFRAFERVAIRVLNLRQLPILARVVRQATDGADAPNDSVHRLACLVDDFDERKGVLHRESSPRSKRLCTFTRRRKSLPAAVASAIMMGRVGSDLPCRRFSRYSTADTRVVSQVQRTKVVHPHKAL